MSITPNYLGSGRNLHGRISIISDLSLSLGNQKSISQSFIELTIVADA
jgi:hypothetical protein